MVTGQSFDAVVDHLGSHGVTFEPGLGDEEIVRVEGEYWFRLHLVFASGSVDLEVRGYQINLTRHRWGLSRLASRLPTVYHLAAIVVPSPYNPVPNLEPYGPKSPPLMLPSEFTSN